MSTPLDRIASIAVCWAFTVELRDVEPRRGVDSLLRGTVGCHEAVDFSDERLRHFSSVGHGRVGKRFSFRGDRLVGSGQGDLVRFLSSGLIGRERRACRGDG